MNDVPAAVSIPVLLASMSLLGLVLKSFIEREMNSEKRNVKRIAKLEAENADLRNRQSEERHLKHDCLNRAAGLSMTVRLMMLSACRCTCGEMASVIELIERTGVMEAEDGR